jgi:hypothetical protein
MPFQQNKISIFAPFLHLYEYFVCLFSTIKTANHLFFVAFFKSTVQWLNAANVSSSWCGVVWRLSQDYLSFDINSCLC